ncbi:hypothetical protein BO78DRAFT_411418 [Aspergillus sclerotiicarbonarius CBS 121057]|uniref:Protein kinase domain-containing protein n=1 Tax=Aspergillus sclerotiicarbonarius (strain CBS 121057 / IBT 28362) TaxID=1448318 RepID=A0A319DW92_ASPSB|nr:hypothetical protein BO78DRAFT_411418 [Aspergillus sclerotiicarbonarius CBS 121057]
MKVIKANEAFTLTISGETKFSYVKYFVQQDGALYYGKWKNRYQPPETLDQLEEVEKIQTDDRGPAIQSTWSTIYIKSPNLLSYTDGCDVEKRILREVSICEILRGNPHPNIAAYYGCQESGGRVSGLCFKRYTTTLLDRFNPRHLNKEGFRLRRREFVSDEDGDRMKGIVDGIRDGITHLHSLGLVHNDINPANVMFDESGDGVVPVIIDFDSCRRIGESLSETETKRTHQWHDPKVESAVEKNDLDAWEELRIWLVESPDEEFLFR